MSVVPVKLDPGTTVPLKAHPTEDAAFDLVATEDYYLGPGDSALISTGLRVAIPRHCVGLVCTRSGLAAKHNIIVKNAPGVIDPGYRGEVKVALYRLPTFREISLIAAGTVPGSFEIVEGDRIAQLLILRTERVFFTDWPTWDIEQHFPEEESGGRGSAGFGSTGR